MIGVIDSGSGGLSVLKALRAELPQTDFLYFGDIKHAPYGNKSQAELSKLTVDALSILRERNVTDVVSACNSVSASLAVSLFDTALTSQRVVEMVGPTVTALKDETRRIAVCATEATIRSGMYENGFRMIGNTEVVSISIPDLAGHIEFGAPRAAVLDAISEALEPHQGAYDLLVLGCTHYPLAAAVFEEVVGPEIEIFDPAKAVASRAKELYGASDGSGEVTFLITQESEAFRTYVAALPALGSYTIEVIA